MNKTQIQIIKKSTLLSLIILAINNPIQAQENPIENQGRSPLITQNNNNKTTITGIEINPHYRHRNQPPRIRNRNHRKNR